MTLDDFKASLKAAVPPAGLRPALRALWQLETGDWAQAHKTVQAESDQASQWVHAHLHRVEGDLGNAGYWYRRIGKSLCEAPLEAEWDEIAAALLAEEISK
ncbi:MAG: hypothetical protein AAF495_07025 [Pseudomonadota bacterium]